MNRNEKKPQVSIVIPVYNVEKYLRKCVDSVLNQTLENKEIILIDDGSTDRSGAICDSYLNDRRVRVLHKSNGGLSDARNSGIEIASADYIGFVDSDDYVEKDMYEVLYNDIICYQADIAICGIYNVYSSGIKSMFEPEEGIYELDSKGAIEAVIHGKKTAVSAVNKLYKKSILKKHPFLVGKTYEDAHFIVPYLMDIEKAVLNMSPKYYYVHREGTITTNPYSKKDLSIIEAYTNNRNIICEKYPDLIDIANFRYYWSLCYVIDKMIRTNTFGEEGEYNKIVKMIRKEYLHILSNRYVGRARKIALTGLMIHKNIYKIFLAAYIKQRKQLVGE